MDTDYLDFLGEDEGTGRIFSLLFNSSNLISPSYAAAIVLGISFGLAALAGLLYYALIGGFDSGESYGSSSGYGSYFQRIFTRRRRSAFEEDLSMLSVVESLDSVEKTINKLSNEIKPGSPISSGNICKMKWRVCQVAQTNRSLYMSRNSKRYYGNVKILEKFYIETRKMRDNLNYTMHFGRIGTEDERKLNLLDEILDTDKYLHKKFSCEHILHEQECINVIRNPTD